MNLFKYNQILYAETICNYGFQTKHKPTELKLLVLYYRDILNYPPAKCREELEKFCKKYIVDYSYNKDFGIIDRALRQGSNKNNQLIVVNSIPIYTNEIEYIGGLELDYECKKVVFALLVYAKLYADLHKSKENVLNERFYFKGGTAKYEELKSIAKIKNNLRINEDVISCLENEKLVRLLNTGCIELLFMEHIKTNDEISFEVKDFDNAGYYFDYYNKIKGIKLCKVCGAPFKPKCNNQEYCKQHLSSYEPIQKRIVTCIDCNKNFEVDSRVRQTERCSSCYKKYRRNYKTKKDIDRYQGKTN